MDRVGDRGHAPVHVLLESLEASGAVDTALLLGEVPDRIQDLEALAGERSHLARSIAGVVGLDSEGSEAVAHHIRIPEERAEAPAHVPKDLVLVHLALGEDHNPIAVDVPDVGEQALGHQLQLPVLTVHHLEEASTVEGTVVEGPSVPDRAVGLQTLEVLAVDAEVARSKGVLGDGPTRPVGPQLTDPDGTHDLRLLLLACLVAPLLGPVTSVRRPHGRGRVVLGGHPRVFGELAVPLHLFEVSSDLWTEQVLELFEGDHPLSDQTPHLRDVVFHQREGHQLQGRDHFQVGGEADSGVVLDVALTSREAQTDQCPSVLLLDSVHLSIADH